MPSRAKTHSPRVQQCSLTPLLSAGCPDLAPRRQHFIASCDGERARFGGLAQRNRSGAVFDPRGSNPQGGVQARICGNSLVAPQRSDDTLRAGGVSAGISLRTDSGNSGARFPTTHWSEVARAGGVDPQVKRAALGRLLTTYLPALKAHLLGHERIPADRADDLLQGFVCDQVVADDLIARADRERGRFRSFVLLALDRYVARVRRSENAQKRKAHAPLLPLDGNEPAVDGAGAGADLFDVAWAREVVQRAIRQMREQCSSDGRAQLWQVFETCALGPLFDGSEAPPHREVMQRLGFDSPQQVSNGLVTAKRMFARVLRSIVGEYAQDKDEIEAELRDLWTILARSGRSNTAASRQPLE